MEKIWVLQSSVLKCVCIIMNAKYDIESMSLKFKGEDSEWGIH